MSTPEPSNRSDDWLLDALREADPAARDQAMQVLVETHQPRLERFIGQKVPPDWVADTVEDVWEAFIRYVQVERVTTNPEGLLYTIAQRKRADAAERVKREREIEDDIADPQTEQVLGSDMSLRDWADEAESRAKRNLIMTAPSVPRLLSPCQSVVWALRGLYDYSSKAVGRLMAKSRNTIDVQFHHAKQQVSSFANSPDFQIALAAGGLDNQGESTGVALPVLIEQFAEPITPDLTPDELAPVGLTKQELQTRYEGLVVLSRWQDDGHVALSLPSLILIQRQDRPHWQQLAAQLTQNPNQISDYDFPEACWFNVDVVGDDIRLKLVSVVTLSSEWAEGSGYALSVHKPYGQIPISPIFHSSQPDNLPEVLESWPFLAKPGLWVWDR